MPIHKDYFINWTDAANVLGYKTYRSLITLIKEGHIKEYSVPGKSRKLLKLSEVMSVAKPQNIADEKIE